MRQFSEMDSKQLAKWIFWATDSFIIDFVSRAAAVAVKSVAAAEFFCRRLCRRCTIWFGGTQSGKTRRVSKQI